MPIGKQIFKFNKLLWSPFGSLIVKDDEIGFLDELKTKSWIPYNTDLQKRFEITDEIKKTFNKKLRKERGIMSLFIFLVCSLCVLGGWLITYFINKLNS